MIVGSALVYTLPLAPRDAVLAYAVTVIGSLAPDIDHARSKASLSFHDGRKLSWLVTRWGGHRTWTHRPEVGPPVFALVTTFALAFLDGPLGTMSWLYGLAMLVGAMTHLYGDARTLQGIPCRWGKDGRIRLGKTIETGSDAEERRYALIYRPVAVLATAATAYSVLL
jgi:membrane-bound metal-dependent hydrolase YbcI (DUF457 family)